MPLKLIAPREGRSKNWRVRGTYLGVYLDRSTETADRRVAARLLAGWREQIERGEISGRAELTFDQAAVSYMQAGGDIRFAKKITDYVGTKKAAVEIGQAYVDQMAADLYPSASLATRNRQVYTPVKAILAHAKIPNQIDRPAGGGGAERHIWLEPAEFDRLHRAAQNIDAELALLLLVIFYTGLRLSEALSIDRKKIEVDRETAFVGKTKNGQPRPVYLPPVLVAALSAELAKVAAGPLFATLPALRQTGGSRFYKTVYDAYAAAGVDPQTAPFHVLRHSFGRNLTRAGADLVATGVWRSRQAAAIYQHYDANEEARKAILIPGARGNGYA